MIVLRGLGRRPALWVVLAAALASLPLLRGLPIGHDTAVALRWSGWFTGQVLAGEWWPRWLPEGNGGWGSPAFFYYPPLAYHATALLAWAAGEPPAEAALRLSLAAQRLLAGLACYAWLRAGLPARAAALGAVTYVLAPYHLVGDLHIRGSLAELWAFVWVPPVLLATQRAAEGRRGGIIGLPPAYAGLVATHLPTAVLMATPMLVVTLATAERRPAALARLAALAAVALALAGAYLLPALALQPAVAIDRLWSAWHRWERWLWPGRSFYWDTPDLFWATSLTVGAVALAVAAGTALGVPPWRCRFGLAMTAVAMAAVLLASPLSAPLWSALPPLARTQFPFRNMVALCAAGAGLVAAMAAQATTKRARPPPWRRWAGGLAAVAAAGCLAGALAWARPPAAPAVLAAAAGGPDVAEYVPAGRSAGLDALGRVVEAAPAAAEVAGGAGTASLRRSGPRSAELLADLPESGLVLLPQHHFPGWRAVAADGTVIPVLPHGPQARATLALPAGRHGLRIELPLLAAERWGLMLSAGGLAAWLMLAAALTPARSAALRAGRVRRGRAR